MQQLKIRLLEQRLRGSLWVGAVGDDDVELVLLVREELEAIANVRLDGWMLETDGHAGEVFLRDADDGLLLYVFWSAAEYPSICCAIQPL